MPNPKDDPKSPEWRPYIFARDQWHCRICGDRFQYSETVRKHIAHAHDENMPPSMYEYFRGEVWQRKRLPNFAPEVLVHARWHVFVVRMRDVFAYRLRVLEAVTANAAMPLVAGEDVRTPLGAFRVVFGIGHFQIL